MPETLSTPITKLFGITKPVILAGMNVAAGPELAAAVTNAGGLGVIGGVGYTPDFLRKQIKALKAGLKDPNAPFGVDLLLPKVGGNARKTNYDYTHGGLDELVDIIIEEGAKLFVCAVGVPPKEVVDRFHAHNIPVMNMIGHPKHAEKAIAQGVDIICAQGGEGGGHTGDVPTSVLIPRVADIVNKYRSPMTGDPIHLVAAGGMFDGRGLAAAIAMGASAVWVGTRFVASEEAGAPPRHKNAVVAAGYADTIRTIIFTGRPLRVIKNPYVMDWETNRQKEITELTSQGILPHYHQMDVDEKEEKEFTMQEEMDRLPMLTGAVAGAIDEVLPAQTIVDNMVNGAVDILKGTSSFIAKL